MKILIDPRIRYNYASYYLQGLRELVGRRNIHFDVAPFESLSYGDWFVYGCGMPIIAKDGERERRIFIDFGDTERVEADRYEWCDVYAKVNAEFGAEKQYEKLFVLGPAFGIQIDCRPRVMWDCLHRICQSRKHTNIPWKTYMRDYVYSFVRRRRLAQYEKPAAVQPNYVFHASTLWYDKGTYATTNRYRGEFLKACQRAGIEIGGGLFFIDSEGVLRGFPQYAEYLEEYKDFLYKERLSMDTYLRESKRSVCVFNTPAVLSCHGWKLGEYLCMGKAIISTPLTREMPGEGLRHGESIHFVESTDEIYDAVQRINTDEAYRRRLEQGARAYYEAYLAPKRVAERLVETAFGTNERQP